ncbi:protein TRM32-like isoform X2 [Actinidia eriantha]|uniref:protein TRM32-like isoform X2 n=1 Tax=Actinidia eriantha TaxID=165200 RepID=UPI0025880D23|nr:protein TRM32-like isoform X2 [Actinidia eriantha]
MGKNLPTGISIENNHPGCMWGILHALHHHRWHHVRKKMLPHKRHGGVRHSMGDGNQRNSVNAPDAGAMQEFADAETNTPQIGEKMAELIPVTKSSMKRRIKAMIVEEVSKRRGRHRRSSSYPARMQLTKTDSIHHLEASELNTLDEAPSNKNSPRIDHQETESSSDTSTMDPQKVNEKEPVTGDEKCELCIKLKEATQDFESEEGVSFHESKQFLEALDIFNMNKELFLKVLQDPIPPSARYFHGQRELDSKIGFAKSMTFPLPGSSKKRGSKLKHKLETESCAEGEEKTEDGSQLQKTDELEFTEKPLEYSSKKRVENKVVTKRFKNLKQKIKQVIKEGRKERHRITMDAVFHKIPYGRKFSKDVREEVVGLWKETSMDNCSKSSPRCMRRMSSFDELLDRYQWLYESTFNAEAKHHISERLKLRTEQTRSPTRSGSKTLGRILSLPDLRSYYCLQFEESQGASYSSTPIRTDVNRKIESGELNVVVKDKTGSKSIANEEADGELGSTRDDSESLQVAETDEQRENEIQATLSPDGNLEEPSPVMLESSQEDKSSPTKSPISKDEAESLDSLANQQYEASMHSTILAKTRPSPDKNENSIEQLNNEFLHVLVNTKDVAEFNYVKYVLELSGFTRNELLGTWHSPDHPVDPSLYEEMEGCLVPDSHYPDNEEARNCYHLLLFDLINEVLLEIYEKSFMYWPKALSTTSNIRPVPVGHHVLAEVWTNISWYLSWRPEADQSLDNNVTRDLAKSDGWMNLQFEVECVGLEFEDMIFDDLLDEFLWT